MKKLAEKEYWDGIYRNMGEEKKSVSIVQKIKSSCKHATRDYSNYIIWEYMLPRYLPQSKAMKAIEIGCAPGKYILNLHRQFGYEPYGVEYSEKGAHIARHNFAKYGFSDQHVIQADFFDQNFQSENKEKYDLVFSRGFIEHYDDVSKVVHDHANMLKTGGYLVIMIPNLSGLNYHIGKFLNADSMALHNLSIMNKKIFSGLFPQSDFETLYCGYVGTLSWGLFNTNRKWKYYFWRIMLVIQRPFDGLWRMICGPVHIKSSVTSPYLIFIGRKR